MFTHLIVIVFLFLGCKFGTKNGEEFPPTTDDNWGFPYFIVKRNSGVDIGFEWQCGSKGGFNIATLQDGLLKNNIEVFSYPLTRGIYRGGLTILEPHLSFRRLGCTENTTRTLSLVKLSVSNDELWLGISDDGCLPESISAGTDETLLPHLRSFYHSVSAGFFQEMRFPTPITLLYSWCISSKGELYFVSSDNTTIYKYTPFPERVSKVAKCPNEICGILFCKDKIYIVKPQPNNLPIGFEKNPIIYNAGYDFEFSTISDGKSETKKFSMQPHYSLFISLFEFFPGRIDLLFGRSGFFDYFSISIRSDGVVNRNYYVKGLVSEYSAGILRGSPYVLIKNKKTMAVLCNMDTGVCSELGEFPLNIKYFVEGRYREDFEANLGYYVTYFDGEKIYVAIQAPTHEKVCNKNLEPRYGVFYTVWDGKKWSTPILVYDPRECAPTLECLK